MIESSIQNTALSSDNASKISPQKKVLKMIRNERMAGSVPAWVKPSSAADEIESKLTNALQDQTQTQDSDANMLSYSNKDAGYNERSEQDEFKFADLIDMVNPLHHIPIVNKVYQNLTGDTIKPIGTIIGGAIFGGPAGAASGLVNAVIKAETGKDLAGNAIALIKGEGAEFVKNETPEKVLDAASKKIQQDAIQDLPGQLLSFSDLSGNAKVITKRVPVAQGRSAGSSNNIARQTLEQIELLQARDPITQVSFSKDHFLRSDNKNEENK